MENFEDKSECLGIFNKKIVFWGWWSLTMLLISIWEICWWEESRINLFLIFIFIMNIFWILVEKITFMFFHHFYYIKKLLIKRDITNTSIVNKLNCYRRKNLFIRNFGDWSIKWKFKTINDNSELSNLSKNIYVQKMTEISIISKILLPKALTIYWLYFICKIWPTKKSSLRTKTNKDC